jgi:hypothetical protein
MIKILSAAEKMIMNNSDVNFPYPQRNGPALIQSPAVHISCLAYTTGPPPQLNGPRFLRRSPQIAYLVTKSQPLRPVVVIMIKMELLTRNHRQPAPAARLAARLSQQCLTQLLMLAAVSGCGGVHSAAPAPRHNTPSLTQTHPASALSDTPLLILTSLGNRDGRRRSFTRD